MRNARTVLSTALAIALAVELAGCASAGMGPGRAGGSAYVSVSNHNYLDMNVFIAQPGQIRRRLGLVTSTSTATFQIPREFVSYGTVRIVAVPIGGFGAATTGQVSVNRGETLVFHVEQNLALSSVTIRP